MITSSKKLAVKNAAERMSGKKLTKKMYNAKIVGKGGCGRPRPAYHDQISRILVDGNRLMTVDEMKDVCRDRTKWRSIVSTYPVRDIA